MKKEIQISIASALMLSVIASCNVFKFTTHLTSASIKAKALEFLEHDDLRLASAKFREHINTEEGSNDAESRMLLYAIDTFLQAEKYYNNGKYQEAIDLVNTIDTSIYSYEFSESIYDLIDKLLEKKTA